MTIWSRNGGTTRHDAPSRTSQSREYCRLKAYSRSDNKCRSSLRTSQPSSVKSNFSCRLPSVLEAFPSGLLTTSTTLTKMKTRSLCTFKHFSIQVFSVFKCSPVTGSVFCIRVTRSEVGLNWWRRWRSPLPLSPM